MYLPNRLFQLLPQLFDNQKIFREEMLKSLLDFITIAASHFFYVPDIQGMIYVITDINNNPHMSYLFYHFYIV